MERTSTVPESRKRCFSAGDQLALGLMTFLVECFDKDEEGFYQEAVDALEAADACVGVA